MIIVMARRVCSSLACLTSLTPPEQAARLNNKVVSANPWWFRAPRKIDTYFSFLLCSLRYDIINCSSSPVFFFFLIWRFKALGHGVTEQGSLGVCDHQASACEVWNFYSGKKNDWWSRSELLPELKNSEGCMRWVLWVLWTIFIFWDLSGYSGPCDPTFQSLSNLSLLSLSHTNTPKIYFVLRCYYLPVSKLVIWTTVLERVNSCHAAPRWLTQRKTADYYCIVTEQESYSDIYSYFSASHIPP